MIQLLKEIERNKQEIKKRKARLKHKNKGKDLAVNNCSKNQTKYFFDLNHLEQNIFRFKPSIC